MNSLRIQTIDEVHKHHPVVGPPLPSISGFL